MRTSTISNFLNFVLVAAGISLAVIVTDYKEVTPASETDSITIEDLINQNVNPIENRKEDRLPVKKPKETKLAATPTCGGNEFLWLVCGVYFEARNQSDEGQYWVAQTILNRVHDPRWPNSIQGVIRDGEEKKNRCQYSFMCDGKAEAINDYKAWEKAVEIAMTAMENFYQDNVVTCAHSYRADYVTSKKALRWFATLQTDEKVGKHIFYCDKDSANI